MNHSIDCCEIRATFLRRRERRSRRLVATWAALLIGAGCLIRLIWMN